MNLDEIAMLAYKDQEPDVHELNAAQWLYFYRLREVYRLFKANKATKDDCERLKQKWTAQYEHDRNDVVRLSEMYKILSEHWKRIETPAREYAMNPTIENADAFFQAVYGGVSRKTQVEQWNKEDRT